MVGGRPKLASAFDLSKTQLSAARHWKGADASLHFPKFPIFPGP